MAHKKCEICKENTATVPDRNKMPGRLINRLCNSCHQKRLSNDLKIVSKQYFEYLQASGPQETNS